MRRVQYLQQVGFLEQDGDRWTLGNVGREYVQQNDTTTLLRIMCERNVGLRSLLYALSAGPMTLAEVSEQQLDTHPELGWNPEQTDMAKQRVNWLRSMDLINLQDSTYTLTEPGQRFVDDAIENWADSDWTQTETDDAITAGTYETVTHARSVDPEFRATVLSRHGRTCPVSGIDHLYLLGVAHVLSWSDYPKHRTDLTNVLPLSKTHHAAFDRELFTIDQDYRLHVNPNFETQSEILQRTIIDRVGERVAIPDESVASEYIRQHNATIEWV